jgi:23S rRNA pseudouridine1911/1915/1917 synthase
MFPAAPPLSRRALLCYIQAMADTPRDTTPPQRLRVPGDAQGSRLDRFLGDALRPFGISREKIKAAVAAGRVLRNGRAEKRARTLLQADDALDIALEAPRPSLAPEGGDLRILYRDAQLAVLDKPAGLTVHPCPSQPENTLAGRLVAHFPELAAQEGLRPGIVHRLDKDTSGLLLVAPDEAARLKLAGAFARREVEKTYLALVAGRMHPPRGECLAPLGRHPRHKTKMAVVAGGRAAHTLWDTLYVDPREQFSLLAVRLHTGRTHQIRVHMAHLGHPLLGDATYAPGPIAALAPRQMLHAWKLAFRHPLKDQLLSFICPPPEDMPATMADLSGRTLYVVITGLPGCGKSFLRHWMQEQGFSVWSADDVIRRCYEPGGDGWQLLHHRYQGRFTSDGRAVDKHSLAQAMLRTPGLREEIETLVHPVVYDDLCAFWDKARNTGAPLAFAEVPLWLESGGGRSLSGRFFPQPILVGVSCPAAVRHTRLVRLRHWDPDMVGAADSWQWPEEKKLAACDHIVDNSGDVEHLREGGGKLLARLLHARDLHARTQRREWNGLWTA